ncbi:MAG: helicase HerA-like domain-containing protein, partial [Actinomycetes bacterium]
SDVLGQLGNRVQHALRAFTPEDAKALKATVSTFPHSPYDLGQLLTQLGIGEAVITVLSDRGAPTPVAWTRLRAPQALMAPTDPTRVAEIVDASPLQAEYARAVDRDSAYERLAARLAPAPPAPPDTGERPDRRRAPRAESSPHRTGDEESAIEKAVRSPAARQFARSAAAVLGREIARSIFGTSRRRRRR